MAAVSNISDLGLLGRDEVLASLQKDPLLTIRKVSGSDEKGTPLDYASILRKDLLLSQQLHDLASLKSISGLIMEFKANFELLELENCYYSLQSLHKKLRDNSSITKQNFTFQQSVFSHVDTMHLQLVEKLYEILSQWFWQVTSDTITFKPIVEWGDDSEKLDYVSFVTFIEQQYFPNGFLDPNIWVIGQMKVGLSQDTVIRDLNVILKEYVNFNMIIETIKRFLFSKDKQIIWENKGTTKKLQLKQGDGSYVGVRIANIYSVASFLDEGVSARDANIFATKLGPVLATELLQTVKSNAYTVLHSSESSIKEEVGLVNKKLKQLATKSNWPYQSGVVEQLLNDNQVHNNLLLDGIFEQHALKVRSIFRDPSFKTLDTVPAEDTQPAGIAHEDEFKAKRGDKKTEEKKTEESWEWGDDSIADDADAGDGWDNELAIEFEEGGGTASRKARKPSIKSGSDELDGWDEEVEINFDEAAGPILHKSRRFSQRSQRSQKSQKSQNSEGDGWGWDLELGEHDDKLLSKSHGSSKGKPVKNGVIKVSKMTVVFISIMEEMDNAIEKMGRSRFDENIYQHKLNVLQTLFFALCTRHFQEDWWQLVINVRYITQRNPSLTRLRELMANLLEIYSNSSLKVIVQLVDEQMQQLFSNEKNPCWNLTEDKLLPFVNKQIIEPLSAIGRSEGTTYLLYFYDCLYVDCINDKILKWPVISERNSDNLAHMISVIYSKTEAAILQDNTEYRQYRSKLIIVGQLLQLHLKEIMAMFYNGDFYLFSTEELVQWLVLLFADTPLRKSAIEEIYEIRSANIGDD